MAHWFVELRSVLRDYYLQENSATIVGYLRGSADPNVWRMMIHTRRPQMIILGNVPPSKEEWSAAGVGNRGETQTILLENLDSFIITYSGFVLRPWGDISVFSTEISQNYHITVSQFKRNIPRGPRN